MIKRLFDVFFAFWALVLSMPVFILLMLLIKYKLGSPIFFRQVRPGMDGKLFVMIKFRTMKDVFDKDLNLLADELRLTRFGKLLRSTSLDELPELWNVLKGDMSIVGPRPLLCEYLPLYNEQQSRRHNVRPGITGWAQINGRNAISWEDKLKLDIWYIDNRSFWLDIKIILLTIKKVIARDGINTEGHVTAEKFTGSNK